MSSSPVLPDPTDRASQRDEDAQYYRQVLHELIELGIAHHLGTHPWKRRTPQDVRDLCARAAQPRTTQPRTAQPKTGDPRPLPAPPLPARTSTGPPAP